MATKLPRMLAMWRRTLLAIALAIACVQLASALAPITHEAHNWRQADVYSVALNFRDRGIDLLHPRIDFWRGPTQIVGMEAPIFPALARVAMFVFGEHPRSARLVNVLFAILAVALSARAWRRDDLHDACVGLAAALSPMALQELRQIQPDALSTTLTMIAAALALSYSRSGRRLTLAAAIFLYSLAAMTKSPALTAGPALFLLSWIERPPGLPKIALRGLAFLVPLAAAIAWTAWAAGLTRDYEVLSPYFHLDFTPAEILGNLESADMRKHALGYLLGGYGVSWLLLPSFAAGIALSARERVGWAMGVWLACALAFCLAFSYRATIHLYYATVLLAPGLYFAGRGLANLLSPGEDRLSRFAAVFVLVCLLPSPWLAELCPKWGDGVRDPSWQHTWFLPLGGIVGTSALVIAACAAGVGWRRRPELERAVAASALFWGVGWALPGELGYFAYATRYAEWRSFDASDAPMRAAVEAHTTRDDLIFVDGYSPWYLHRARRRGFSIAPDANVGELACKTDTGVGYYLHLRENGRVNFPGRKLEPLAASPDFELSRIVPPLSGKCQNQPSLFGAIAPLPQDAPFLWRGRAVQLVSAHSGKCMTATASVGGSVRQTACDPAAPTQRFRVEPSGPALSLALDAPGDLCVSASDSPGVDQPLRVARCAGAPAELLDVKTAAPNTYFLAVHGTERVWDATPFREEGRRINRFDYHGGACQQWRIEPLPLSAAPKE